MKRKIGFTLAELLVVVVVLAVLAGVAIPKFTRVLETRKTTEAEQMLAAVRMEQEKRCTMGKQYTMEDGDISTMAGAKRSPNYDYDLNETGAIATSKDEDNKYTLKMLSYQDGRICCDGPYCESLNKNYVSCTSLKNELIAAARTDECAIPVVVSCSDEEKPEIFKFEDDCNYSRPVTCVDGVWQTGDWVKGKCFTSHSCPEHATYNLLQKKCICDDGYLALRNLEGDVLSCDTKIPGDPDPDPDPDTPKYTCITSASWRTRSYSPEVYDNQHGGCMGNSSYTFSMPTDEWISANCSGAYGSIYMSGGCSSGQTCDCVPGRKYYMVGSCKVQDDLNMNRCKYYEGGYCFTCGEVSNTNRCATWDDFNSVRCGNSGSGTLGPTTPGDHGLLPANPLP